MLSGTEFRELVSGRRRSLKATLLRGLFGLAEIFYRVAVRWRNWRYDVDPSKVHRVNVPVVSVGNLTVGGTGKTPMVEWLARWFRQRGVRVSLISRGYGAEAGARNDEALELEQKLPDVPHLQDPDRVAAAETAIEECESQLILLDDAFQHRRIYRDLDIVLIDALEPFGYGHVLPRGLLREPLSGLARADVACISRVDLASTDCLKRIRETIQRHAPGAAVVEVAHAPRGLVSSRGEAVSPDALTGKRVAAFCGIGNPAAFQRTLELCGYHVSDFREFPDHHGYQRKDIDSLAAWADQLDVAALVCTEKDSVKIGSDHLGRCPLWALRIGLVIVRGGEALEARLQDLLCRLDRDLA